MPSQTPFRIKQRRKELGLSQEVLAKACGVGQSTVANWERGGHVPRPASLAHIAAALETDEIWLVSGERANARGPFNDYLLMPIHHVAVFDWPQNEPELNNARPQSYIAVTSLNKNLFALIVKTPIQEFGTGTALIFTRDYDAPIQTIETETGLFLDITQDSCSLSHTPTANTKARLIYSLTSH